MKLGDFTEMAKYYANRAGYSHELLEFIKANVEAKVGHEVVVADVGAGTGKLTERLEAMGLRGYAVEPNDAMRAEGEKVFAGRDAFQWMKGSAEITGLPDNSVDWVLMGDSFHWADPARAREEFRRILKPGGFFTAVWKPRDIERSELHVEIEKIVYAELPNMKRVSSGWGITNEIMLDKLGDAFENLIYMDMMHDELMSKTRYMDIWRSVNDIQVQAGEEGFKKILSDIEKLLEGQDEIYVPYRTRAWTARVRK